MYQVKFVVCQRPWTFISISAVDRHGWDEC